MKKPFNAQGQQTYASRQEELEAHARKIDDLLRTPRAPGVHFTPSGTMRKNADKHAHTVLAQKRVDIAKELRDINAQMQKRQITDKSKAKTL